MLNYMLGMTTTFVLVMIFLKLVKKDIFFRELWEKKEDPEKKFLETKKQIEVRREGDEKVSVLTRIFVRIGLRKHN